MTGIQSLDPSDPLVLAPYWEFAFSDEPLMSVGQAVQLVLYPHSDPEGLEPIWNDVLPGPVSFCSNHYGPPPDRHWVVEARVGRLWKACARYRAVPPSRILQAEPGSGEAVEITQMQRWDQDWFLARDGIEPEGWIMHLLILDVLSGGSRSLFKQVHRAVAQ